jgi:ArsR family transcriptional regulator, zinc-responsive transcriptional repressor
MCAVTSDAIGGRPQVILTETGAHPSAKRDNSFTHSENPALMAGRDDRDQDQDHPSEHSSERSPVDVGVADGRPSAVMSAAGDLLRALAAPVRIAIVLELRAHDLCVHELVEALGVAQPLVSQHLRVLKSAGVVRGERHGREVVYSLVDEHLAHIVVDAVAHVEEGR